MERTSEVGVGGSGAASLEADCPELSFLLDNMGAGDRESVSTDFLARDVDLSRRTRDEAEAVWGKVPDAVFFEDVLPYRIATETVTGWRQTFHSRWWPKTRNFSTRRAAVRFLNRAVFTAMNVSYKKDYPGHVPDQDPSRSQELGHASCTGLSIILASACRAVGIPARLVMTPSWVRGASQADPSRAGLAGADENHSWVEIYDDGKWFYIGASEDSDFDKTWFSEQASRAIAPTGPSDYRNGIYAVSFKRTGTRIPAPWNAEKTVNVLDVTGRYTKQ